jgi:drug/metabolite transporter (DMT)-like permease
LTSPALPDTSLKTTLLGVFFGCTAAVLGGMTVALTRFIVHQTDPLSLASVRYGIGALVLVAFMLATRGPVRIERRDVLPICVLGIIMFAGLPSLMTRALEETTAARAAIIFSAIPLSTIILGVLFRVERLTVKKAIGVGLGVTGAIIALGERVDAIAPDALRGDMFMIAGITCASVFNVFSKKYLMRYGSMPINVYAMLIGSGVLFCAAMIFATPFSGSLDFDLTGWFIVFMLAVPGAAVMMVSWGKALQLISPTQAAITVGLNPVSAVIIAVWLIGEPPTVHVFIGFVLILAAVVVANMRPRRARQTRLDGASG